MGEKPVDNDLVSFKFEQKMRIPVITNYYYYIINHNNIKYPIMIIINKK